MNEEKVRFKNSRDQELVGILHSPDAENPPGVVMAHGLGGDKDEHGLFTSIASNLCEHGYSVLRFDFTECGESEGESKEITRKKESKDLRKAVEYLKERDVDEDKVGVIALSLGTAASVIEYNSDVKTMVLMSSALVGNVVKERYRDNKEYMEELREKGHFTKPTKLGEIQISKELFYEDDHIDYKKKAEEIDAPILMIHGTEDTVVPLEYAEEANNYFKNSELELIEDTGHNYQGKYKEVQKKILKWLNQHLK